MTTRQQGAPAARFSDDDVVAALPVAAKVRLLTGADNWRTNGDPGIGLWSMVTSDGPAGVRGTTRDERHPSASLPCPSALGATWDDELVGRLAAVLGAETRSKGVDILLAPTLNLMRTLLGGRRFEFFAEDPVLTARMAVAYVRGLQRTGGAAHSSTTSATTPRRGAGATTPGSMRPRYASCTWCPLRRACGRRLPGS
jgi:beta-glucosidase-like glycosyl hydrolase